MAWSEEKRKKIWGRKANPAVLMGIFLMIASVGGGRIGGGSLVLLVVGLIILVMGFRLHQKYKK